MEIHRTLEKVDERDGTLSAPSSKNLTTNLGQDHRIKCSLENSYGKLLTTFLHLGDTNDGKTFNSLSSARKEHTGLELSDLLVEV